MHRKSQNKPGRKNKGSLSPPSITTSLSFGHVFRFQASAASTITYTTTSLGDLLCIATGASAAYQLASAIRLSKIEVWGPPASNLSPVTVSIDFPSGSAGSVGPSKKVTDTSVGATRVAHVVASPPRDSQASQWQSSSSALNLFEISVPTGGLVDVHYAMTFRDSASVQAVTGTVAGATVGQLYVRSLDSVTNGAVLMPISMPTI